ncbi:MAG: AIM24 family protein [Deltaproteobacteria bacterium]|nr:AIM24 family protein [Deltaproteobacteria bacterium]
MSMDVTFDKLLLEATDLLFQGDLARSRAKIDKALARKPGEPRALTLLANNLNAQSDHAGASAVYAQLLREFPDEPALHFMQGCEYLHMGELNIGFEEIAQASGLEPQDEKWSTFKALLGQELGIMQSTDISEDDLEPDLVELFNKVKDYARESSVSDSESVKFDTGNNQEREFFLNTPDGDVLVRHMESGFDWPVSDTSSQTVHQTEFFPEPPERQQQPDVFEINMNTYGSFAFSPSFLKLPLESTWYLRENNLLCWFMDFNFSLATQRYRGQVTQNPVSDSVLGRLLECRGRGSVILQPLPDCRFFGFDIDNTPLYIREELIVSFQGNLKWENGWLRGEDQKLAMISFRGRGKVFVQLKGPLYSVEMPDEELILAPIDRLVGWDGYVVAQYQTTGTIHAAGKGHILLTR